MQFYGEEFIGINMFTTELADFLLAPFLQWYCKKEDLYSCSFDRHSRQVHHPLKTDSPAGSRVVVEMHILG